MKTNKVKSKVRQTKTNAVKSGIYGIDASKSSVIIRTVGSDLTGTVK
jgi:hypothetical protein